MQAQMRYSNHNFVACIRFYVKRSKYTFGKLKEGNEANENFVSSGTVRGFHMYKSNWKPEEGEKLMCYHEDGNPYDMFSMKVCKPGEDAKIVGHLLMEISRITHFILPRGNPLAK